MSSYALQSIIQQNLIAPSLLTMTLNKVTPCPINLKAYNWLFRSHLFGQNLTKDFFK